MQKNNKHLHMDRQCKKTTNNLHMDRQCKKAAMEHLQCSRQCKKTTTIYIWTVHIYRICNIYEYYVHDIFMTEYLCHVICATALFFTSSQQHVVGVSVVASLGTCSATSSSVADLLRPNTLTINNCHVHYHAHPSDSCDDLFYILSKLMSILFQVLFKAKNPDSPLLAYF